MKKLLFLLLALPVYSAQAVFVSIEIWKGPNGQTIVCLGDFHNFGFKFSDGLLACRHSADQIHALRQYVSSINTADVHFITEDRITDKPYDRTCPVQQSSEWKKRGYTVYAAECRFFSGSLTKMFQNTHDTITQLRASNSSESPLYEYCRRALQEVQENQTDMVQDLHSYIIKKGGIFKTISDTYKYVNRYLERYSRVDFIQDHPSLSVDSRSATIDHNFIHNPIKQKTVVDKLNLWDSNLLDIQIMRNVEQSLQENKRYIFVCAGVGHIENLKPALEKLGCTLIHTNQGHEVNRDIAMEKYDIIDVAKELAHISHIKKSDQVVASAMALTGAGFLSAYRAVQQWRAAKPTASRAYQQPARMCVPRVVHNYGFKKPATGFRAVLPTVARLLKR